MLRSIRILPLVLVAAALTVDSARAEVARSTLRDVSLAVLALYNAGDGLGLHDRLSPPLASQLPIERLTARLSDCQRRLGVLQRLSLPVAKMGTAALFAAYFETGTRDMYLEVDRSGHIRLLTFSGLGESCALIAP
jgi:hypothetical protein